MAVINNDLWKSRYLNELNANCGMSGYSDMGRPLIKNQWTKIKWDLCDLDGTRRKYCCLKTVGDNNNQVSGEKELCMNCAGWLDKYYRELDIRTAEIRGSDALVPLLEQIIENQNKLQKGLNNMCEFLSVIARNTEH